MACLYFLLGLLFTLGAPISATLVLPRHITSHMVLQREPQRASIHGTADAGATISLYVDQALVQQTTSNSRSKFVFDLEPQSSGGPHRLVLSNDGTGETITLEDIMFGDVILCSGQSNVPLPSLLPQLLPLPSLLPQFLPLPLPLHLLPQMLLRRSFINMVPRC